MNVRPSTVPTFPTRREIAIARTVARVRELRARAAELEREADRLERLAGWRP